MKRAMATQKTRASAATTDEIARAPASQEAQSESGAESWDPDPSHDGDTMQSEPISWLFDDAYGCDVIIADDRWQSFFDTSLEQDTKTLVRFCAGLIEDKRFDMCLRWTNDAEMQSLNAQFRDKDKATNVLSFPNELPSADGEALFLGDVAFGFETMAGEAQQMGVSIEAHMRHLIIHGLLHLMGFDHETEEDATEMEGLEIAALAVIGVSNPYFEDAIS